MAPLASRARNEDRASAACAIQRVDESNDLVVVGAVRARLPRALRDWEAGATVDVEWAPLGRVDAVHRDGIVLDCVVMRSEPERALLSCWGILVELPLRGASPGERWRVRVAATRSSAPSKRARAPRPALGR